MTRSEIHQRATKRMVQEAQDRHRRIQNRDVARREAEMIRSVVTAAEQICRDAN
jgi:hypothetical protein